LKKIIDLSTVTIDKLEGPELAGREIGLDTLRLDKLHPVISGNKWFKLKEHLGIAVAGGQEEIVTFGGAWSNHIVATAYAARELGLRATGMIRGENTTPLSDTLQTATGYGMRLEFMSRSAYKRKEDPEFLSQLSAERPQAYILPEGGAGAPGIEGSEDILRSADTSGYSHVLCAIGTGTMWLGLARASVPGQQIIGIPVLKGLHRFPNDSRQWLTAEKQASCRIVDDYHFGGYARKPEDLLDFMRRLYAATGIPTDFVYTGKLFYAVLDMAAKGLFPAGSQLLVIHSGGLQGNRSLPPGTFDF
jgi:1-aminocyclopropane-1-carboxylate deaminase